MNRSRKWYGVAAVLAAVGVAAWIGVAGQPQTAATAAVAAAPVLTVSVVGAERRSIDDTLAVVGTTVPRENVVVVPELTGLRVREIHAEVGDYVKKGQLLALLDSANLDIQSHGLQSEFERTRDEYARVKALQPSGAVSREFVSQKNAAYEVARANLRDAQLNIRRARVVAPTDGVIYDRKAAIGSLTSSGEALFQLARNGEVEMEASVPERSVARLRGSLPASLAIAGETGPVRGAVRLITPHVNSANRSARVRIALERDGFVPVGVFCEARITVSKVDGWVLPGTALQQDTRGPYVWSLGPKNQVARTPVTVVTRTPEHVVVETMTGGERVVAKAGSFLKEGDLVAVAKRR